MIQAVVLLRVFYSEHILYVFHHTDQSLIAVGIGTYRADVGIADVVAHGTMFHVVAQIRKRSGERVSLTRLLTQQMQHQTERRLATHPWQLGKFRYCLFKQSRGILLVYHNCIYNSSSLQR